MSLGRRLACGVAVALVLATAVGWGTMRRVRSQAMSPLLESGSLVVWNPLLYRVRMPYRGDVVLCRDDRGDEALLRVAAIGGDMVEARGTEVLVNGSPVPSSPLAGSESPASGHWMVPGGCVFLLADARSTARDSRHYGVVPLRRLQGRVVYRVTPLRYRGWI